MNGSSLETLAARMRRQRTRGEHRAAWRCAVSLTVRDELDGRWWMHRAALALTLGLADEAERCARQAAYLFRHEGNSGRTSAVSMWLARKGLRAQGRERPS